MTRLSFEKFKRGRSRRELGWGLWWRRAADWIWPREAGSQLRWGRALGGASEEGWARRRKGGGE